MPRICSRCGKPGHDRRGCDVPAPAWAQALQARPAWAQALQASDEVHAPARATAAPAELETVRELWPSDVVACLQAIDAALERVPGTHPISPWWWGELRKFYASERWKFTGRVGRRGGKSDTVAKVALAEILTGRHKMPLGDVGTVAIVSVDRDEAAKRVATIAAYAKALGIPHKANAFDIEFKDRPYVVEVKTASVRGVSGFTSILCVCDEMDKWADSKTGANPADSVIDSLEPTLLTMMPGARMFMLSSPWLIAGPHARRFNEGMTDTQHAAYAPSWIAHPAQTREKCWALSGGNERKFLREYEAIPQPGDEEDEAGVTQEKLARAISVTRGREPELDYAAGLYACPRTNEWALMIVTRRRSSDGLIRTAVVHTAAWPAQIDARVLLSEVRAAVAPYGVPALRTPSSGFALAVRRVAEPLGIVPTDVTDDMHESLRVRFNCDGIELPDVADLRADILAQRKRVTPTSTAFEARRFAVLLAMLAAVGVREPPGVAQRVSAPQDGAWWADQEARKLAHDMRAEELEGYRMQDERNRADASGDWVARIAREAGYG